MMQSIIVAIMAGPLGLMEPWDVPGAGAIINFDGVVRLMEEERELVALHYEDYAPMAERELQRLAQHIIQGYGVLAVRVEHSRGTVPVGRISFRLQVASRHRKEGLVAMEDFIDRMKQDVPIWKNPVWKQS